MKYSPQKPARLPRAHYVINMGLAVAKMVPQSASASSHQEALFISGQGKVDTQ
jgi:hypothetical protein